VLLMLLPPCKRTAGKDEVPAGSVAAVIEQAMINFQRLRILVDFHAGHLVFICTFKPPVFSNIMCLNRAQATFFIALF
jgi:hypothetical protein